MKRAILIGLILAGCLLAQKGAEQLTSPMFGALDIWFCLGINPTTCHPTLAEAYGSRFDDTTCYSYVMRLWALDADSGWVTSETMFCTTVGFSAVYVGTGVGENLWSNLFSNINTHPDGMPWGQPTGFTFNDTLCIVIGFYDLEVSPTDSFHVDTCMAWETEPGDVELHLVLAPFPLSTDIQTKPAIPDKPTLGQNSPNPFNAYTDIEFSIPEGAHVRLEVTDVLGKHVATLMDTKKPRGTYRARWNSLDDNGNECASGVYFYKLTVGDNFSDKKKMTLVK